MKTRWLLVCLLSGILLASCNRKQAAPESSTENQQQTSAQNQQQTPATPAPQPPNTPAAAPTTPPPEKAATPQKPSPAPAQAARQVPSEQVRSEAPPQVTPPPPPPPVVLPAGTVLTVRLEQGVSSKTNKAGDRFVATVSQPLVVQGKTVVPTGAGASGTVTEAQAAGKFKGAATLNLALDTLVVRGVRYRIQTTAMSQTSKGKGKRSATMIGGGTGAGALIGGLAGGGKGAAIGALAGAGAGTAGAAMTGNKNDISLPVETAVSFQLTAPVALQPPPPTNQAVPGTQASPPE